MSTGMLEYDSIAQMQGSRSQRTVAEPAAFERTNYLQVLRSYTLRGGCGAGASDARAKAARPPSGGIP